MKNEEENALANVPRGEERNLAGIVGLPLVVHGSKFGTPYWVFAGPEPRASVEARVARALRGRGDWQTVTTSGWKDGQRFGETNWTYNPRDPLAEDRRPTRPLDLDFHDDRATPVALNTPSGKPWTTVTVVARGRWFVRDPIGERLYPGL